MILAIHLSKAVLMRILAVTLALAGLALALDLVDSAAQVMKREDGGILWYLALRTPLILGAVLPVGLIVGPVLAFLSLSGRNEFTIMRTAGATTYRLLLSLLPLAVVLGVSFHLLVDRAAPRLEAALLTWLDDKPAAEAGGFWARTTTSVIRVRASSPGGGVLFDLDIYETDRAGGMVARIDAESARYEDGGWRLSGASRLVPGESESVDAGGELWRSPLTPANIRALATPGRSVAGDAAGKMLRGDWAGNRAEAYYEVRVYRGYVALLAPALLILLAAPATFGGGRSGGAGKRAAWAVALGFGFLLVDGMLTSLGESGNMPPAIAAFGAAAMFAAIGGWALVTLEE